VSSGSPEPSSRVRTWRRRRPRFPEHAGHSLHTVFVDDLDERVESIGARGIEPFSRESCGNAVRKVIYRDPDGNEIGFGGAPLE
jgi:hypothetical protein